MYFFIKMLIEKHVCMFTTSDAFHFQITCQIFCPCIWNNLKLVLIDYTYSNLIVNLIVDP